MKDGVKTLDALAKLKQGLENHDKGLSKQAAALIRPIGEILEEMSDE